MEVRIFLLAFLLSIKHNEINKEISLKNLISVDDYNAYVDRLGLEEEFEWRRVTTS